VFWGENAGVVGSVATVAVFAVQLLLILFGAPPEKLFCAGESRQVANPHTHPPFSFSFSLVFVSVGVVVV